jgi:hypothetical protein
MSSRVVQCNKKCSRKLLGEIFFNAHSFDGHMNQLKIEARTKKLHQFNFFSIVDSHKVIVIVGHIDIWFCAKQKCIHARS